MNITISNEGIGLNEKTILQITKIVRNCLDEALQKTEHKKAIPLEKPNLISRKECSQILGVSLVTLNEWEKKQILLPIRINTRVRYRMADVEKALIQIKPKKSNNEKGTI